MSKAQMRISTGYRVGAPSDNAAYWSIATTMRSDSGGLSAVRDALGLAAATADIAYTGVNAVIKLTDQIKQKLVAAREPGLDRTKIQGDITSLQGQLRSAVDAASASGQNWLSIDSTSGTSITKQLVSSLARDSTGTVSVGSINVSVYDASTGATIAMLDANATASAKAGILDKQRTTTSGSTYNLISLDVHALTDSTADLADLDSMISGVDAALVDMASAGTSLGTVKSRIALQSSFLGDLVQTFNKGVGELVDADMNEESTRLQALQTKQSLAIQSLSIANSNAATILRLFQ